MDDTQIIELLIHRSDQAIPHIMEKYGKLCFHIAYNITHNTEDAEECVNDTYLQIWNSIPPQIPNSLSAYISKITRNTALNLIKHKNRHKRKHQIDLLFSELTDCIPSSENVEDSCDDEIVTALNNFLDTLDFNTRTLFIRRYFHMESIQSLAEQYNINPSTVSTKLNRTRKNFRKYLEKEGICI